MSSKGFFFVLFDLSFSMRELWAVTIFSVGIDDNVRYPLLSFGKSANRWYLTVLFVVDVIKWSWGDGGE